MQFHTYQTATDFIAHKFHLPANKAKEVIQGTLLDILRDQSPDIASMCKSQFLNERQWNDAGRPYYNVWPTAIPLLTRIDLSFPGNMVRFPAGIDSMAFNLPTKNNPLTPFKSAICSRVRINPLKVPHLFSQQPNPYLNEDGTYKDVEGLLIHVDTGESSRETIVGETLTFPNYSYVCFPLTNNTLDDEISRVPMLETGDDKPEFTKGSLHKMLQLIVTCLMVADGNDQDLIRPDILSRDENAYFEALRNGDLDRKKTIEDRAFRRRGPGWNIGEQYEDGPNRKPGSPYVVPPHPQRYWVGKGRERVIVKTRKGYIVEREQIVTVPTGRENQ